jgi:hypothetical protein
MSIDVKKLLSITAAALVLCGCTQKTPSDSDLKTALDAAWSNYTWEFSDNFTVDSFKRVNGWQDGEAYWIETQYKVKSKYDYYDIVFACVENTAEEYTKTAAGQMTLGLSAMMKGFQGTRAFDEYLEHIKTHPAPEKAQEVNQKYKPNVVKTSFLDCANHLSDKATMFHSGLKKGDLIDYSEKLRFKKTEQGWRNL